MHARNCDRKTEALLCYTETNGTPQGLNVADVIFAAKYLLLRLLIELHSKYWPLQSAYVPVSAQGR